MKKVISYAISFTVLFASISSISFAKGEHSYAKPTKEAQAITTVSTQENDGTKTVTGDVYKPTVTKQVYGDPILKQNITDLHKKFIDEDKLLKQYMVTAKKIEKTKDSVSAKASLTVLEQKVNVQKELNKGYSEKLKVIIEQMKGITYKGKVKLKETTILVKELERENSLLKELDRKIQSLKEKFDIKSVLDNKKTKLNKLEKAVKKQKETENLKSNINLQGNGNSKGHK